MSETISQPELDPAAAAEPESDAPADTGAATETTPAEPSDKDDPAAKRIGRLTARLAAQSARNLALEERLAALERGRIEPPAEADPELDRRATEKAERIYAERVEKERVSTFHEAGKAAFPDWQERCQSLMEMGADPEFAKLLVDTPDGAKVAAALADDPDAMERIAALKSPTGRALALGRFAATLETKVTPPVPVSRAPAPIRPVTGGVRVQFNEYTASPAELMKHYEKQAMEARRR